MIRSYKDVRGHEAYFLGGPLEPHSARDLYKMILIQMRVNPTDPDGLILNLSNHIPVDNLCGLKSDVPEQKKRN